MGEQAEDDDVFRKAKLEKSPAVVTIEMTHPRNFGLNDAMSSQATGFVVDAEKGILLSNRHVVNDGPCRAKARFQKNEEIDLLPVYRDPLHDFGFFKFDPKLLVETKPTEIELEPEGATRGKNALIIGNNGGERLSFVPTTVARTDRPSPPFFDMNTFFITASDTGVGGSSGAPLLTSEGKAIGMMAGGKNGTNISLYLPLFRVQRALEYFREGKKIPRGTIQASFNYQTFDALIKRKAITDKNVAVLKAENATAEGCLIVEKNLPKGPAKLAGIKNGDVLYKMNGKAVSTYVALEDVMDTYIKKNISITVIREGTEVELKTDVQDLEDISIDSMVEVSNGVFHGLEMKIAAEMNLPLEGVFVAKEGYMFRSVPFGAIVKRIGKRDIHQLADFIDAVQSLENGEVVSVRYTEMHDQNKTELATITVDKRWYPFQIAKRDDKMGKWHYKDVVKGKNTDAKKNESKQGKGEETIFGPQLESVDPELAKFIEALVEVKYSIPFPLDGSWGSEGSTCTGIIVDKELGLVITDKENISTTLIDVQLVFCRSKTIHASVVFIHPVKSISIIKFDPALLAEDNTVRFTSIKLSCERPTFGEKLDFVGVSSEFEAYISEAKVLNFRDFDPFGGEMMGHSMPALPQEVVTFSTSGSGYGFYLDKKTKEAKVIDASDSPAVCASFVDIVTMVQKAIATKTPVPSSVRSLPITASFFELSEARINDLSDEWSVKLQKSMTVYQQKLLIIKRRMVSSDAYDKLFENDVILALDGKVVTLLRDFYAALEGKEKVKMTLLRNYKEIEVEVETTNFSTLGTTRIIHFGGLIVQDPHPAIFYLSTPEYLQNKGVYVTHQEGGSPAEASQMANQDYSEQNNILGKLIFKVNDTLVEDLQQFSEEIKKTKHNEFIRLAAKDIVKGEESVHHIRLDLEYWKSRDMHLSENGSEWKSKLIEHLK